MLKLDSSRRKHYEYICGQYVLELGGTTKVMGILNVTRDSFSQDGIYKDPERAVEQGLRMAEEGAEIIDVGGESTRPGACSISVKEEKTRVLPVLSKLVKKINIPISIDTTKSEVAYAALAEGASIVNDVSGLRFDSQMAPVISRSKAGCVIMHIKGTPRTMQKNPFYTFLIEEIIASLKRSISIASSAGIESKRIMVDPGIGFGKTTEHNLQIINRLKELTSLDLPILLGVSRKSFIGNVLEQPVDKRIWGTQAAVAVSIFNGVHVVRVHDVKEISQTIKMVDAIMNS